MANASSVLDFTMTRADWLAQSISDGTWADVIQTIKTDLTGQEAAASEISEYAGQLWSNLLDDMMLHLIQHHSKSTKLWKRTNLTALQGLGSNDNLAVNDVAYVDADTSFYYCDAVTGATSSTWTIIGGALSAHASTHQNGGADEINVGGLSGVLADPQTPATHEASHRSGGSDELSVLNLAGYPGGTSDFLRADGSFAAPPGGGGTVLDDVLAAPGAPEGGYVLLNNGDGITTLISSPAASKCRIPYCYYTVAVGSPPQLGMYVVNAGAVACDVELFVNMNGRRFSLGPALTVGAGDRTLFKFAPSGITGNLYTGPVLGPNDVIEGEVTGVGGPIMFAAAYRDLPPGWTYWEGNPGQSNAYADILTGPAVGATRLLFGGALLGTAPRGIGTLLYNTDANTVTTADIAISSASLGADRKIDGMAGGNVVQDDIGMFPVAGDAVIAMRNGETLRARVDSTYTGTNVFIAGAYKDYT